MSAAGRRFLGNDFDLGSRHKVFEIPEGIEVDEISFLRIERTRVYFDDVLALTYHRHVGWVFVVFMLVLGGFFGLLAVVGLVENEPAMTVTFGILASPFLLALLLRLILRLDIITLYGKRTKARMRFGFRKGRARQIYADLSRKIRAQQDKVAASQPKPPAPEIPLPPPPAEAQPLPPPPAIPGPETQSTPGPGSVL